tara:strand:- start:1928 stop:2161 length:234 start_codon:yes stop_codon:yes gene_type:complete
MSHESDQCERYVHEWPDDGWTVCTHCGSVGFVGDRDVSYGDYTVAERYNSVPEAVEIADLLSELDVTYEKGVLVCPQ